MFARPLRLNEIVKRIELEIGCKDPGYLAPQWSTYCNNRSARGECQVRR